MSKEEEVKKALENMKKYTNQKTTEKESDEKNTKNENVLDNALKIASQVNPLLQPFYEVSNIGKNIGTELAKDSNSLFKVPEYMKDNNRRFEDGYQFGDVIKTLGENFVDSSRALANTTGEIGVRLGKGLLSVPENIANAGASLIAASSDSTANLHEKMSNLPLVGNAFKNLSDYERNFANELRKKVSTGSPFTQDVLGIPIHETIENVANYLDTGSFTGSLLDSATEGIGQTFGQMAISSTLGNLGQIPIKFGNHVLNMPTTAFLTGLGSSASETYAEAEKQLKGIENATWREKAQMALKIVGGGTIEGITEGFFGLLGMGGTDITDKWQKEAIKKARTSFSKILTNIAFSGGGEAAEEFLSYAANWLWNNGLVNNVGKLDYSQNWNWDDVFKEMASAFISSGISQGGSTISQINKVTKDAIQVAEYQQKRNLTAKEKTEIKSNVTDMILGIQEEVQQKMYPEQNRLQDQQTVNANIQANRERLRQKGYLVNEDNTVSGLSRIDQIRLKHGLPARNIQATTSQNTVQNTIQNNAQQITQMKNKNQNLVPNNSSIQGLEDYTEQDIKDMVADHIQDITDAKINNITLREENGNLQAVVDSNTDLSNIQPLELEGKQIDIVPRKSIEQNGKYDIQYAKGKLTNGEDVVVSDDVNGTNPTEKAARKSLDKMLGIKYKNSSSGNEISIENTDISKFLHDGYNDYRTSKLKKRISGNYGEVIEIAKIDPSKSKGNYKGTNRGKKGYDYYDVNLAYPIRNQKGKIIDYNYYTARLVVRKENNGDFAYDLDNFTKNNNAALDKTSLPIMVGEPTSSVITNSITPKNNFVNNTQNSEIDKKINSSMTQEEAKEMVQRAFIISDISDNYKNGDEWLKDVGTEYVGNVIENNDPSLRAKYVDGNEDIANEEYTIFDVLDAYVNGTLTGKQKNVNRLDTSKSNSYKDEKFYAPRKAKGGIELYNKANQRVTNSNRQEVYRARGEFIINAHNEGYVESLGLSKEEVNKKIKYWADYTQRAMNLSNKLNEGVALENRWTGIENSSIVNTLGITDNELDTLVKDIIGESEEYERKYIVSAMLALDTHINYKNLIFEFAKGKKLNSKNNVLAQYSPTTDIITISRTGQNTEAHEMGHYIDRLWGREIFGNNWGITDRGSNMRKMGNLNEKQTQFMNNFYAFLDDIESTADIDSKYKMSSNEVFARFVARFVEWTKNVATNNRYGYENEWYKDNFNERQYREFVKILQEKSLLDTTEKLHSGSLDSLRSKDVSNNNPLIDEDNDKTLVATHNLSEEKLKGILELGGFPVPSIAISDVNKLTPTQFGDITVIFDRDTINPENTSNKVYDRDVWSPTFPNVSYNINNANIKKYITNKLDYDRNDSIINEAIIGYMYESNLSDKINRKGKDGLLKELKESPIMQYFYKTSVEKGQYTPEYKEQKFSRYHENKTLQRFIDLYNKKHNMPLHDFFEHYINYGDMQMTTEQRNEIEKEIKEALKPEVEEYYQEHFSEETLKSNPKLKDSIHNMIQEELNQEVEVYGRFFDFLMNATQLDKNGVGQVIDEEATLKDISKNINKQDYENWIDNTFGKMLENTERGIRNEKDAITDNGRRSWKQLHYEYNLNNIIKAMKKNQIKGGESTFLGNGFGNVQAMAANEFDSISDIKKAKNRLTTSKEANDMLEPIKEEIEQRITELSKYSKANNSLIGMGAFGIANDTITEFAGRKNLTIDELKKVLKKYPSFDISKIPNEVLQNTVDSVKKLKDIYTDYFEAKPQRAVGLDEIRAILVPNTIDSNLKKQLLDRDMNVVEYDPKVEGDRETKYKEATKEVLFQMIEGETQEERAERVRKYIEETQKSIGTLGAKVSRKDIVNRIIDNYGITTIGNSKELNRVSKEIQDLIQNGGLTDGKIEGYAQQLIDNLKVTIDDYYNANKELKELIRRTKLYVSDNVKAGFGDFNDFKKQNIGTIRMTNDRDALPVDTFYQELAEVYGETFFPSDIVNASDQLEKIAEVASQIKKIDKTLRENIEENFGEEAREEIVKGLVDNFKTLREKATQPESTEEIEIPQIKNRSWTKTATSNDLVNQFLNVKNLEYVVRSNKETAYRANERLETKGYDDSLRHFESVVESGKFPSVDDIALGERLIQEAIKQGDFEKAEELIADVTILGTELGQSVQAMSMIKRLSPAGQLMYLQKAVKRINEQERKKRKPTKKKTGLEKVMDEGKVGDTDIKIPDNLRNEILSAQTPEDLQKAVDRTKEYIASQLPVTLTDKLTEWRYLMMLGNPKTHVRNTVGNLVMQAPYEIKNFNQRVLETLFDSQLEERTATFKKATKAVKDFADAMIEENRDALAGTGYTNIQSELRSMRKIYKSKAINALNQLNTNALELEDFAFKKHTFRNVLAEYLTANGIKTEADIKAKPELIQKAINYAIEEAKKATFNQYNAVATAISRFENSSSLGKVLIGGLAPFKRTPLNIVKTAWQYSPAGLAGTLTKQTWNLRNGLITPNDYIERISQGLTGTGIALMGMLLASLGLIKGSLGSKKKDKYEQGLGLETPYSFQIGNKSIDISWLSPSAVPLLMGAEIYSALEDGEWLTMDDAIKVLEKTMNPVSKMTMLSTIDDALINYGGDDDVSGLAGIFDTVTKSYISQAFPTLGGQINRIIDPTIRSTAVSKNSKFKTGETILRQNANKVAGLSYMLEPSLDVWGNPRKRDDNVVLRSVDALVNPANITKDTSTEVDHEILRLYDTNGNDEVIPTTPQKYFTANSEKYEMSASEYTEYRVVYGQTSYENLEKLFNSSEYKKMSDNEKETAIKHIYDDAKQRAKLDFLTNRYGEKEGMERLLGEKDMKKVTQAKEVVGINYNEYLTGYYAQTGVEGEKDRNGETINGSVKKNKIEAIKEALPKLSNKQAEDLYKIYSGTYK